tara:strand:- start:387 stop:623 length:237 start_codon:yes stop_codon:yes gene_type:complete
MKTLVRPQPYSTIAISTDRLKPNKTVKNQKIYLRNNKKIISYLFLLVSFSVFLFLPESPKLSESICTNNNPELACNVW